MFLVIGKQWSVNDSYIFPLIPAEILRKKVEDLQRETEQNETLLPKYLEMTLNYCKFLLSYNDILS